MSPRYRRSTAASLLASSLAAILLLSTSQTQSYAFSAEDEEEQTQSHSFVSSNPGLEGRVASDNVHEEQELSESVADDEVSPEEESFSLESTADTDNSSLEDLQSEDQVDFAAEEAQSMGQSWARFRGASGDVPEFGDANDPSIPEVLYADGGTGRFKDLIQWMNWANRSIFNSSGAPTGGSQTDYDPQIVILGLEDRYPKSTTRHNYRDVGESMRLVTSCTASQLDHSATRRGKQRAPLVATIPGAWRLDALDNMYNRGGEGASNQLVIGMSNTSPRSRYRRGDGSTPQFDVACQAYVWTKGASGRYGSPRKLPIDGIVFADAESPGYGAPARQPLSDEWIEVTAPESTKWYVLDAYESPDCRPVNGVDEQPSQQQSKGATTHFGIFQSGVPAGYERLRLIPNGPECSAGTNPGVVLLAQGASALTARLQGNGAEAIALGIIVPTDFGDAPASYGDASAFYQPVWGNEITAQTTNLIRGIDEATMGRARYSLGHQTSHENVPNHSERADRDGGDDAVTAQATRLDVRPGGSTSLSVSCNGDGMVAGWIDWNINGRFDANEKSDEVRCHQSSATLRWNVPLDALRAVHGEALNPERTFMRLRTAAPPEVSGAEYPLSPVGATLSGEVEDHEVQLYVPQLRLINEVVSSSPYVDTLRPASDWTVSATHQGSGPHAGQQYSAAGALGPVSVPVGVFTLGVSPAGGVDIPEYTHNGWQCAKSQGTSHPLNAVYNSSYDVNTQRLTIPQADHVTCKIVHAPVAGSLRWSKTDARGNALSGSEWTLRGPNVPQGLGISDCRDQQCSSNSGQFVDKDPRPGFFSIEDIRWGSYTLQERRAPAGYVLNAEEKVVEVKGRTDLGAIVNEMRRPLVIPLTGGTASLFYVLAGGGLTVVAVAGAAAIGNRGRSRG